MANEQQLIVQWGPDFDEALREVGVRAPPSTLGQTPNDYVRETCPRLKRRYLPQNNEYHQVNYRGLRADALSTFVPQLVNEVKKQVKNPDNLKPGEILQLKSEDPMVRNGLISSAANISRKQCRVLVVACLAFERDTDLRSPKVDAADPRAVLDSFSRASPGQALAHRSLGSGLCPMRCIVMGVKVWKADERSALGLVRAIG